MRHIKSIFAAIILLSAPFTFARIETEPAKKPDIFPDYTDITIPPNIAPMNFIINEKGSKYRVIYQIGNEIVQEINTHSPRIQISENKWKDLLSKSRGSEFIVKISVFNNRWTEFIPFTNRVANEEVDSWIVYRYLKPLYSLYYDMSIRQRNIETFNENIVLPSWRFDHGCVNCHTFLKNDSSSFALHIRKGKDSNPMLLCTSNTATMVDKTFGYLSWHPSGKLIAFSLNKLSLFFHATEETRDVFDEDSNLGIYNIEKNEISLPQKIAAPDINETWPCWSADGKFLYYCAAKKHPIKNYRDIKYDLVRISYDISTDRWGEPETLVSSDKTGLSTHQPKISPDSKHILFAMSSYGNFPVYRPDSDLYLFDTNTRQYKRLELNSNASDSWHCWSSNGKWILFSSKRIDGLFARPHIAYFDTNNSTHKPFVIPQKEPEFYLSCIHTFNVPEFSKSKILTTQKQLLDAINRKSKITKPQETDRKTHSESQIEHYGNKPNQTSN